MAAATGYTCRGIGALLFALSLVACRNESVPSTTPVEGHAPIVHRVSGQTPHRIGRLLSNGQTHYLFAEQGDAGFLFYGARMSLPEGSFRASFRLRADRPIPNAVAEIDVHAFDPSKRMELFLTSPTNLILASASIRGTDFENPGQFQDFFLRFSTRGLATSVLYELRIQSSGQTGLWLEHTEVQRIE